jgi:hypothetical protein
MTALEVASVRKHHQTTIAQRNAAKARSILQEYYLSMRLEEVFAAFLPPILKPGEQRSIRLKNRLARFGYGPLGTFPSSLESVALHPISVDSRLS